MNIATVLKQTYPHAKIVLLEKEASLGAHASGRNSGVLHSGCYYVPNSLKAQFTRAGNLFLRDLLKKKQLPFNDCGKLIVAKNEEELKGLEVIFNRAKANGAPMEEISVEQAKKLEPLVRTHKKALWSPSTAAADPVAVLQAQAQDAAAMGVEIQLGVGVRDLFEVEKVVQVARVAGAAAGGGTGASSAGGFSMTFAPEAAASLSSPSSPSAPRKHGSAVHEVDSRLLHSTPLSSVNSSNSSSTTTNKLISGHRSIALQLTDGSQLIAGHAINCAGLYADKLAKKLGFAQGWALMPFKGLYLYASPQKLPVTRLIYPVPDLNAPFLGVHFTVTADGHCKIGPTAIPAFWREHYWDAGESFWARFKPLEAAETLAQQGAVFAARPELRQLAWQEMQKYSKAQMVKGAGELVEGAGDVEKYTHYGRAGIRAQLVWLGGAGAGTGAGGAGAASRVAGASSGGSTSTARQFGQLEMDFLVEGDSLSTHVLNAVSPGWTCSRPFAEHVVSLLKQKL